MRAFVNKYELPGGIVFHPKQVLEALLCRPFRLKAPNQ